MSFKLELPKDLSDAQVKIESYARHYGLDFFKTSYEVLTYKDLNEVASYMGFPNRYPHWKFGMEYTRLSKSFAYGLHRIYEMVINNDPAIAYLLHCNNFIDQKMVMAHVCGHSDFFKNNYWFSKTNRKAMDMMANHANEVRQFVDKYGQLAVENFLDTCLSLEDLIDRHAPFIARRAERKSSPTEAEEVRMVRKIPTERRYLDRYINPTEFLEDQERELKKELENAQKVPENPEKDLLQFLIMYAPIPRQNEWQRRILEIIREEAYYFAPQGMTKIMNEGWATFWHTKIMESDRCDPYLGHRSKPPMLEQSELIEFAEHHSGTVATQPGRLNPYKLGLDLFRDIEDRWNKGRFGKAYDECDDAEQKRTWDRKLGLGRKKVFEVRKFHNDVTFIDEFLTEEFCRDHKLFSYSYKPDENAYIVDGSDFPAIKRRLLFSITNHGQPHIYVTEGNHNNRGELYLRHRYEGIDLDEDYAKATLRAIRRIWGRKVFLQTIEEEKGAYYVVEYECSEDSEGGVSKYQRTLIESK